MKTIVFYFVAVLASMASLLIPTYAQTLPPTPSSPSIAVPVPENATLPITGAALTPAAQQIIIDAQTQCREHGVIILEQCVNLWHESPTTLVLNGEVLIQASPGGGPVTTSEDIMQNLGALGNYPNIFIWQAVDGFKAQGYTVSSVTVGGQGSQGNPHEFFVVMSK